MEEQIGDIEVIVLKDVVLKQGKNKIVLPEEDVEDLIEILMNKLYLRT